MTYKIEQRIIRHQQTYRRLLGAISRPGRSVKLEDLQGETALAAAMAVGACLLDHEVTLCVVGSDRAQPFQATLAALTQARPVSQETADYVFVLDKMHIDSARRAKRGRPENPEESATLVFCIDDSSPSLHRPEIRFFGPGIAEKDGLVPEMNGIPFELYEQVKQINADGPMGVDLFFVRAHGELMALPRSTRIQMR
jgi:alpha-D-ribose 1-methylphosphonate 5-triphosphate synthase subunit PhnH